MLALVVRAIGGSLTVSRGAAWLLAGLGALGASAVLSAVVIGRLSAAVPLLLLLFAVAVVLVVVSGSGDQQRWDLTGAISALGAFLGLSGWVGVAFRTSPLAHVDGNLWRAATFLTYANAAAAFLTTIVLLSLARLVVRPCLPARALAVASLVGLFATLSRGGFVCVTIGFLVLLVAMSPGLVLRHTALPLVGAGIASAVLARSMPVASPSHPWLAALGLAAGLAIGMVPVVVTNRAAKVASAIGLAAGVVAAIRHIPSLSGVWAARTSLSSPDRTAWARSAWSVFAQHPVTGVGPGQATFFFSTAGHHLFADRYAHDGYLQLAAEQGAIGLAALGSIACAIVILARRSLSAARWEPVRWALWAGACAALVSFAVEGSLDFLWHVPSVDLLVAVAVALLVPSRPTSPASSPSSSTPTSATPTTATPTIKENQ